MMQFLKEFDFNPLASVELIEHIKAELSFSIPQEYCDFLIQGNGGDGFIGENYVILWKIEELIELNQSYQVSEYAPGLFLFGSNGGGEAFAFDLRNSQVALVKIPFVGMDLRDVIEMGASFTDFLSYLYYDK